MDGPIKTPAIINPDTFGSFNLFVIRVTKKPDNSIMQREIKIWATWFILNFKYKSLIDKIIKHVS